MNLFYNSEAGVGIRIQWSSVCDIACDERSINSTAVWFFLSFFVTYLPFRDFIVDGQSKEPGQIPIPSRCFIDSRHKVILNNVSGYSFENQIIPFTQIFKITLIKVYICRIKFDHAATIRRFWQTQQTIGILDWHSRNLRHFPNNYGQVTKACMSGYFWVTSNPAWAFWPKNIERLMKKPMIVSCRRCCVCGTC